MDPNAKVVDCVLHVAAPGNPMVPWIVGGTIVIIAVLLAIIVPVIVHLNTRASWDTLREYRNKAEQAEAENERLRALVDSAAGVR